VTGTGIGITAIVARVAATVLMITRSVGETGIYIDHLFNCSILLASTYSPHCLLWLWAVCHLSEEALVVAAVLMITRGVAETGLQIIEGQVSFSFFLDCCKHFFFLSTIVGSASPASKSPSRSPPRKMSPSPERSPVRRNNDRSPRSRSPST
jgi:hypothetical protein